MPFHRPTRKKGNQPQHFAPSAEGSFSRFSKQFYSSDIQPQAGTIHTRNLAIREVQQLYPRSQRVFTKSRCPASTGLFPHMLENILSLTPSLPVLFSDSVDAHTENRCSLLLPKALPFTAHHEVAMTHQAYLHMCPSCSCQIAKQRTRHPVKFEYQIDSE